MIVFFTSHPEATFTLLGSIVGILSTLLGIFLTNNLTNKREEAARLFNERKDAYLELIFLLRELFLASEGHSKRKLEEERIDFLLHKCTFLASTWSLRHQLPIISALVKMKYLEKDSDYPPIQKATSDLGQKLPAEIKKMEDAMREELGIIEK